MSDIVLELQKECLDDTKKVSSLIRKAYVISKKLNIQDFTLWSQNELNGYSLENIDLDKYPKYRIVNVEYKAFNPYHGWIPVIIPSQSSFSVLLTRYISESIDQIENLLTSTNGTLSFSVSSDIQEIMNKSDSMNFEIRGFIGKTQFVGVLKSVRNIILDWTLKLEENKIIGSGISFSSEEIEKASTGTVNYGTIIYGSVQDSQVVGFGHEINQTITISDADYNGITKLLEMIEKDYTAMELSKQKQDQILITIKELREELNTTRNKSKSRFLLNSLKSIFEGVAGSLIASGIVFEIAKYIS